MKRLLLLAACWVTLGIGASRAGAATITVPSNPLWTDTGITLSGQDAWTIHDASGSWNFGGAPGGDFGPDGFPDGTVYSFLEADEWIPDGYHGQLIGFVGDDPYAAMWTRGTRTRTSTSGTTRPWRATSSI